MQAQKAFVKYDCGRRYAKMLLQNARPMNRSYGVGDFVMYYNNDENATTHGEEWNGPARIIGFEERVVWLQHAGVPVASALNMLRPASTAEMLA